MNDEKTDELVKQQRQTNQLLRIIIFLVIGVLGYFGVKAMNKSMSNYADDVDRMNGYPVPRR